MTKHTNNRQPGRLSRIPRRLRYPMIGAAILAVALAFSPLMIRHYATQWLLDHGADQAMIDDLDINPFTGRIALEGVYVEKEGQTVLANASVELNLGLRQLFDREVLIERSTIEDVVVDIEQFTDGTMRIGSYHTGVEQPAGPDGHQDDSGHWVFAAAEIVLDNVLVRFARPELDLVVQIKHGAVQRFSTDAGQPAGSVKMDGTLNDAPFSLDITSISLGDSPNLAGTITISGFSLETLAGLLEGAVDQLDGQAGMSGSFRFAGGSGGTPAVHWDGTVSLENARAIHGAWTGSGALLWQGAMNFQHIAGAGQHLTLDGTLTVTDAALAEKDSGLSGGVHTAIIDGATTLKIGERQSIDTDATVSLQAARFHTGAVSATVDQWQWRGHLAYAAESLPAALKIDGSITAGQTDLQITEPEQQVSLASFALTSAATVGFGDSLDVTGNARLAAQGLNMMAGGTAIGSIANLAIEDLHRSSGLLEIGALTADVIEFPVSQYLPLTLSANRFALRKTRLTEGFTYGSAHELELIKPQISTGDAHLDGDMERISLTDLSCNTFASIAVRSVAAQGGNLSLLARPDNPGTTIALTALEAADLSWNREHGTTIGSVAFSGLNATLNKEKEPVPPPSHGVEPPPAAATPPADDSSSRSIPLAINQIIVDGASSITFRDRSLARPFQAVIDLAELRIDGLDFTTPDTPFHYKIKATVDTYAPLIISGTAAPLAAVPKLTQQLSLHNYPLPDLSPFLVDSIGTEFIEGRLSLTSAVTVSGSSLVSDNTVVIDDAEARTADEATLSSFNKSLPVPLETALFLLADQNQKITLTVPVSGELDHLSIGIGGILTTALSTSITTTVLPYLAYTALGPTGALSYLGLQLGKMLLDPDLPAVRFPSGVSLLGEEQQKILDDVGAILQDRFSAAPEDTISLCSVVSIDEVHGEKQHSLVDEMVRRQLFTLGDARAAAVRDYLTTNHRLDDSQLLSCSPRISFDQHHAGLVEFKK